MRPRLEGLEDRCCPTTVGFANGTLTITGDGSANTVNIAQNDNTDKLVVTYDVGGTIQQKTYFSSSVHNIDINLGGGNDACYYYLYSDFLNAKNVVGSFGKGDDKFYFLSAPPAPGAPPTPAHIKANLSLDLDMGPTVGDGNDTVSIALGQVDGAFVNIGASLGSGDDTFEAHLNGDLKDATTVQFAIFGEGGVDALRVFGGYTMNVLGKGQVKVPCHIDPKAFLDVYLDGGADDDIVGLYFYGEIDGYLLHHLEGGDGVDIVLPMISKAAGSTGTVLAY